MDLLTRNNIMCTPAMALDELMDMRKAEKWYVKRLKRVRRHLERCRFHGRPLLDEPMSMASIDAVLKEAWFVVNTPAYRQREFEQVTADANRGSH